MTRSQWLLVVYVGVIAGVALWRTEIIARHIGIPLLLAPPENPENRGIPV